MSARNIWIVERKCRVCNAKFVLSAQIHPDCDLCPPCNESYERTLREGMDKFEEDKVKNNAD